MEIDRRIASMGLSGRFILLHRELGLWIFLGKTSDHVILEGLYCSCHEFQKRIESRECTHLKALLVARERKRYRVLDLRGDEIAGIIWEVFTIGHSPRLRSLIYSDKLKE